MRSQQLEFLIRNERTRCLYYAQGLCVCKISEGNINYVLTPPPPPPFHIR